MAVALHQAMAGKEMADEHTHTSRISRLALLGSRRGRRNASSNFPPKFAFETHAARMGHCDTFPLPNTVAASRYDHSDRVNYVIIFCEGYMHFVS